MTRFRTAPINYLGAMDTLPYFYARERARDNLALESHRVRITDARQLRRAPELEREGFQLYRHPTAVRNFGVEAVAAGYCSEIAALVRELTGADHAAAMGVVRRFSERESHPELVNSLPARFVHMDYSPASFFQFAARHLGEGPLAQRLRGGRCAAYNIWRVLTPPPQDVPLAVCAAPMVAETDRITGEARIDGDGPEIRFGSSLYRANPAHRWFFYSDMTPDEVLVFKAIDSDPARTQGCPHTAFDDPEAPVDARPRASVETRVFAYWFP
jgi:hypothetical protein